MVLVVVAVMVLGGCSGMSYTQQRMLSGGAIGVSGGTLVGWAAGCPACGAAIGGGAGVVGAISMTATRNPRAGFEAG